MTTYLVYTSPRSEKDVRRIFARIAKSSPTNAQRFLDRIEAVICGLADVGASLDPAPEGRKYRDPNLRQRII